MAVRAETASPVPDIINLKSNQDQSQDANSALLELEKGKTLYFIIAVKGGGGGGSLKSQNQSFGNRFLRVTF